MACMFGLLGRAPHTCSAAASPLMAQTVWRRWAHSTTLQRQRWLTGHRPRRQRALPSVQAGPGVSTPERTEQAAPSQDVNGFANGSGGEGFDIITGERLAPPPPKDSQPTASTSRPEGFLSGLEAARRGADELQAELSAEQGINMDGEEASFQSAATALQKRLVMAVRAEVDYHEVDMENIYKPKVTQNLRQSGRVLLDLTVRRDGALYGSSVWRFQARPDPARAREPQEGEDPLEGQSGVTELPYHRFAHRDALLISTLVGQDAQGLPVFVQADPNPVTVLEVRRAFIRVVATAQQSEVLSRAGPDMRWRMDFCTQVTTAERQIQAISLLDRPWSAAVEHQETFEEFKRRRRRNPYEEPPERQPGAVYTRYWTPGERRVRQILLGHPDTVNLAAKPPAWLSDRQTLEELRRHLVAKPGLNHSQRKAIATTLVSTFTLWQGPPGTGKTRTIHALIEALVHTFSRNRGRFGPLGQILVCADTNAATDNIVEGVWGSGIDIVRIGQPAKVREEIRGSTLEARARETPRGQEGVRMQEVAAQVLEGTPGSSHHPDRRSLTKAEKEDLARGRQQAQQLWNQGARLVEKAEENVLNSCQVVAATLAGSGDMQRLAGRRFRMVVLDEASQATEPSTLIPLMRGAECVVMAGDPQQLPPTVSSDLAFECELDHTVFDRLQASGLQPSLLDTQYRMHPQIAEFPSQLFYDGLIQTGITAADRPLPQGLPWPNPQCPVVMVECEEGREERSSTSQDASSGREGSSFFNEGEAKLAIRALEALLSASDSKTAAILTPYNAQLRFINGLLRRVGRRHQVTVSTVDGYQGREADVVIFSAVRNNEQGQIGFVSDPRRLNVAITRPRRGLVVVGSPSTLSSDPSWRAWIAWVREHGCFLSPNALPHSQIEQDEILRQARKQLPMRVRRRRTTRLTGPSAAVF